MRKSILTSCQATCFLLALLSLSSLKPPESIPPQFYDAYTNSGTIPVISRYCNDTSSQSSPLFYDKNEIDHLIEKAKQKQINYYGSTDAWLYSIFDKNPELVHGKTVAIMGSNVPWYEAIILAYGGIPFTIEYNRIKTNDPRLRLSTVEEFRKNPRKFDVILSISSFEHDGLGRYGDPLDPNGDLRAMKDCFSMLTPNGKLILAVPIGGDCLVWNAHRIYGPKRLPKLLKGWRIVDYAGDYQSLLKNPAEDRYEQPVFVLEPDTFPKD